MGGLTHNVQKPPPRKNVQKPPPGKNRKKTGLTGNPKVKWENKKMCGNHHPEKTGFNWKNRKNGKWEKWESVTKMKKTKNT